MSLGPAVIRNRIYAQLPKMIDELRGDVVVVGFDATLLQIRPGGGLTWAILIESTGALVGPENNVCYVFAILGRGKQTDPREPSRDALHHAVAESIVNLRTLRRQQLLREFPNGDASAN